MIPTFPKFIDFYKVKPKEYRRYVNSFEPYSDFNYVSVYSWNEPGSCSVSSLNGNIVLSLREYLGHKQVLTFLGNNEVIDTAKQLLDYANSKKVYAKELQLIPKPIADDLRTLHELEVEEDHANHDYILSGREYVELAGKMYENKRKNLNKFTRMYGEKIEIKVTRLDDEWLKDNILRVSAEWVGGGTEGSAMAENETRAIIKIVASAKLLESTSKLYCIQLLVDNKLEGYCIFELLNNYAITHFGKANTEIQRAYEYMMAETYKYIYQRCGIDLVNNEQDLGISGLRHSKLAQHPTAFLRKYSVRFR